MLRKIIVAFVFLCSLTSFAQPTISNVYVQSSTATTATIVWTTGTPATSQIIYGFASGSLIYSNNTDYSLVTSHSMTMTILNASQPYYFAAVSRDGSGSSTTSSTYEFALCGSPMVPVNATVTQPYAFGTYTATWNPPAGSSGTATVCGHTVTTTVTGKLNLAGSFSMSVADSLKVTPGPGSWTVHVTDPGNLGPISVTVPLSASNQDISSQLQAAAASAGNTMVIANTISGSFFPDIAVSGFCPLSGCTFTGNVTAPTFIGHLQGNADSATTVSGIIGPAQGGTGVANPTGYAYGNGTGNFTFSTTIPWANISGAPSIPTSSDWPNAGTCPTNEFETADTLGAPPTCAQVTYAQLGGTVPTWNQSTTGNAATATKLATTGANATVWGVSGGVQQWVALSSGTVTSVGLSLPTDFNVTVSPITSSGNLTAVWATTPTGTGAIVRTGTPTITTPVIMGTSSGTGVSTTGGPGTLAQRDGNNNLAANNFLASLTTVTSSGGTTTLTVGSSRYQTLSGTNTQTFQLPNATTLAVGNQFTFNNNSTGNLSLNDGSASLVATVLPGAETRAILLTNSTTAGTWDIHSYVPNGVQWGSTGLGLNYLLAQPSNTIVGNALNVNSSPTALTVPSCGGITNALTWTPGAGFGCNTISTAGGTVSDGAGTTTAGLLAESTTTAHIIQYVTANASAVGLGSVTNDTQTKDAVVPNTLPGAGQILVGNAGATAYAPRTMSGDATLAYNGVITVAQAAKITTNGTSLQVWGMNSGGTAQQWMTISGGGTTTNAVTFNNGGTGAVSGTTFNGSTAVTISYNTLGAAPLASPTFTGAPVEPTATPGTNTTQLATTAFVATSFAPLASPIFTGTVTTNSIKNSNLVTSITTSGLPAGTISHTGTVSSGIVTYTPSSNYTGFGTFIFTIPSGSVTGACVASYGNSLSAAAPITTQWSNTSILVAVDDTFTSGSQWMFSYICI